MLETKYQLKPTESLTIIIRNKQQLSKNIMELKILFQINVGATKLPIKTEKLQIITRKKILSSIQGRRDFHI